MPLSVADRKGSCHNDQQRNRDQEICEYGRHSIGPTKINKGIAREKNGGGDCESEPQQFDCIVFAITRLLQELGTIFGRNL